MAGPSAYASLTDKMRNERANRLLASGEHRAGAINLLMCQRSDLTGTRNNKNSRGKVLRAARIAISQWATVSHGIKLTASQPIVDQRPSLRFVTRFADEAVGHD
jgi:hypothetical protein